MYFGGTRIRDYLSDTLDSMSVQVSLAVICETYCRILVSFRHTVAQLLASITRDGQETYFDPPTAASETPTSCPPVLC